MDEVKKKLIQARFKNGLPAPLRQELGVATYAFSELETALDLAISHLMRKPGSSVDYILGGIVTAGMAFSGKINLFGSLYRYRFGEMADESKLKSVLKQLSDAASTRNDLQHGQFRDLSDDGYPQAMMRTKATSKSSFGLKATYQLLSQETIEKATLEIGEACFDFRGFWVDERERIGYKLLDEEQEGGDEASQPPATQN